MLEGVNPDRHLYTENGLLGDMNSSPCCGLWFWRGSVSPSAEASEELGVETPWTSLPKLHLAPQSAGLACLPHSTGGFILPPQSRSCSGLLGTMMIIPMFVCVSLLDQPRGLSTLPVPL